MCGIAAIIGTTPDARPVERGVLDRLSGVLAGRGPDASGLWVSPDARVGLLNRRLATQDARPEANQPCWSHDRVVVAVMNGEIYNHRALRSVLEAQGCAFATRNDTEVLANGYRVWGRGVLDRIKGQFAFAAFDTERGEALVARDPHGICPLYWAEADGLLAAASTVEAVLAATGQARSLDRQAAQDFFVMDSAGWGRTLFAGVSSLRAGHCFAFRPGTRAEASRFMSLAPQRFAPDLSRSEAEWVEAVRASLLEAGRVCMLGDKEVGVYLSGGIDSLSAMALVRQAYPDLKVQTFSIGYAHAETGEAVGELDFARQMAEHFHTIHHEILVTQDDLMGSLGVFDLPPDSILHLCNRKLATAAAGAGVNVALCGEGSDEIFFGYDHFHAAVGFLEPSLSWLGATFSLRGDYAAALDPAIARLEDVFRGGGVNIDLDNDRSGLFLENGTGGRPVRQFVAGLLAELAAEAPDVELDKRIIYLDFCQKLPENTLRRGEGPSMDKGVEMRFPFLWPDLIDLLYTMPMAVRVGDGTTKHILRKAMAPFLPAAALARPKSPFGLPAARRMHFDKAGLVFDKPAFEHFFWKHRERLNAAVRDGAYTREGLFNPDFVARRLAAQAKRETAFYDGFLWKLWNFAEWYEKWIA